ncbi:MAG TPA: cobalt-precorrin-6A reductase [Conexibacter sp.]|jgi:precorrin-6A/cobalt-precorrin-6A reductase|nr:cobalt-precorrin-6A reductase [Conexibacter sp.]
MILILGGTAEARELAVGLDAAGIGVTSSLAGRVARPRLPAGEVRIGGFGGPDALARWLVEHRVRAVVDATHPFAERISASAAQAAPQAGVPLLRLARPGWSERPGDRWTWVESPDEAAAAILRLGGMRVLLTSGRQGLAAFAGVRDAWFLIRCVDPPEPPLPPRHELLLDRGPYTPAGERALVEAHAIDLIVTKDSGGTHTAAKLDVARERGLPVIVVRRPARVGGAASVVTVATVTEAFDWALARGHPG